MSELAELLRTHAAPGRVTWIGLRPERLLDLQSVDQADLNEEGLTGDHARPGKRAVTLIQAEHLPVISSLAGLHDIQPQTLRRNILVEGINLTALRHNRVRIGDAEIELTVPCAPCSRMERTLGRGGYNAMRGHGGWCAQVVKPGRIALGGIVLRVEG